MHHATESEILTICSGNLCCLLRDIHSNDGGIVYVWVLEQKVLQV
jgi:hypothetical protein